MDTQCKDTLEVERIGILYCQREDGHDNGHKHFTDGIVDAEWKRNPLEAKVEKLSKV